MGANGFRRIGKENTVIITIRNISIKTSDGKLYLFLVLLPLSSWNVVTKECHVNNFLFQIFCSDTKYHNNNSYSSNLFMDKAQVTLVRVN